MRAIGISIAFFIGCTVSTNLRAVVYEVAATVETTPVPHSGDRADDAKIWVHPTDAGLSIVIGSDKDEAEGG